MLAGSPRYHVTRHAPSGWQGRPASWQAGYFLVYCSLFVVCFIIIIISSSSSSISSSSSMFLYFVRAGRLAAGLMLIGGPSAAALQEELAYGGLRAGQRTASFLYVLGGTTCLTLLV